MLLQVSFTFFDLPGDGRYLKNIIPPLFASRVALLTISATDDEPELRGLRHLGLSILPYTFSVRLIVIAVTKMDHISVNWSRARYEEVVSTMTKKLGRIGFGVPHFLEMFQRWLLFT